MRVCLGALVMGLTVLLVGCSNGGTTTVGTGAAPSIASIRSAQATVTSNIPARFSELPSGTLQPWMLQVQLDAHRGPFHACEITLQPQIAKLQEAWVFAQDIWSGKIQPVQVRNKIATVRQDMGAIGADLNVEHQYICGKGGDIEVFVTDVGSAAGCLGAALTAEYREAFGIHTDVRYSNKTDLDCFYANLWAALKYLDAETGY